MKERGWGCSGQPGRVAIASPVLVGPEHRQKAKGPLI